MPGRSTSRRAYGFVEGQSKVTSNLEALVGSPQIRQEMGVRARRHVGQAHAEESVAASFERAIGAARVTRNRRAVSSALERPR